MELANLSMEMSFHLKWKFCWLETSHRLCLHSNEEDYRGYEHQEAEIMGGCVYHMPHKYYQSTTKVFSYLSKSYISGIILDDWGLKKKKNKDDVPSTALRKSVV